ncbi:hypothetical protein SCUCBS95973_006030 [Sporothrix curviconia]|uniref:Uncharacterized protein n=1 Tax=Sporothrix curviconia TaxID=1260050 RepID=A0ABP0C1R3_9PEZI
MVDTANRQPTTAAALPPPQRFQFEAAEAARAKGINWLELEPRLLRLGPGSLFQTAGEVQALLELEETPPTFESYSINMHSDDGTTQPVQYCLIPAEELLELRMLTEQTIMVKVRVPDGRFRPLHTPTAWIPGRREERQAAKDKIKAPYRIGDSGDIVDERGLVVGNIYSQRKGE